MKNKFLKIAIILVMIFSTLPLTANAMIAGEGTPEFPFIITTQEQLLLVSDFPDCCFELGNDIVLTGDWVPLCTYSDDFTGTFNGNGYTISNLGVTNFKNAGLFATNAGTIENLNVITSESGIALDIDTNVTTNVGILTAINNGNILNCEVSGNISYVNGYSSSNDNYNSYSTNIGGICGKNTGTVKQAISDVTAYDIDAYEYHSKSYGYGKVYLGGIAGDNAGNIEECGASSECSLKEASSAYFGGIVGTNSTAEAAVVSCRANGTLDSSKTEFSSYVGGIAGKAMGKIENSYFIGELIGYYVGGVAGYSTELEISNCYASSVNTVSSSGYNKGLVHSNSSPSTTTVTNSFYDQTVSGATDTGYGSPKSTLAMKMKRTYTNADWDFENVWGIDSSINGGYPYLLCENVSIEEELPYTLNAITLKTEDGTELEAIPTDSFYLEVNVTKNSNSTNSDYLIIAVYDENGAIIDIGYMSGTYYQYQTMDFGTVIDTDKTIGSIKSFVWDNTEFMKPLSNVIEITN